MGLSAIQQQAIAKWHELGNVTPTNPVLQMAYDLYIAPMGIVCDALSYDALAAIENKSLKVQLVQPRFDPQKVDKEWSQFETLRPLMESLDLLSPVFDPQGAINEFAFLKDFSRSGAPSNISDTDQKRIQEFEKNHAQQIFALSEVVLRTAKFYIDASLNLMTEPEEISVGFAKIFLSNPKQFALVAFQAFGNLSEK